MPIDYSKPIWDPRFGELDTLIEENHLRKSRVLTEAEQIEARATRVALLKHQATQRVLAKRALRKTGTLGVV